MPHVIAVANLKGGAGKTTTALWLAFAAGAAGERVLVYDADPQQDALLFAAEATGGRPFAFPGGGEVEVADVDDETVDHGGRWVVVDTGPRLTDGWFRAVGAAELVVVPMTAEPAVARQFEATAEAVAVAAYKAGAAEAPPVAVLLTRVRPGTRLEAQARARWAASGHTLFGARVPERQAFPQQYGRAPSGPLHGYGAAWAEIADYFGGAG